MIKNCIICNAKYVRYGKQIATSKFCSKKCESIFRKAPDNTKCTKCGLGFHLKESAIKRYNRTMGIFCSMKCSTEYKNEFYLGINNPNFRGRQYDSDGYRINHYPKVGRIKEHQYVVLNFLEIDKVPKGYVIHHRDCNIYNNDVNNLSVLSESDHRWIHKQFGNATLWAFMQHKISLEDLVSWSNDPEKAEKLLTMCIVNQKEKIIEIYGNQNQTHIAAI